MFPPPMASQIPMITSAGFAQREESSQSGGCNPLGLVPGGQPATNAGSDPRPRGRMHVQRQHWIGQEHSGCRRGKRPRRAFTMRSTSAASTPSTPFISSPIARMVA